MEAVASLQEAIAGAAERVGPSVVGLGRGWSHGSGVVIGEGRVLTNAHNLRREQVTVVFADGRRATGEVAAADPDLDLAVVEVDTGDSPAITWEPGDAPAIGAPVLALANPGGAACASRSASSPRRAAASAGPGDGASAARSSTRPRFRAARPGGRSWTWRDGCSG